jgi:pimeloyl-ACP methyl ester carboxylesterase
MRRVVGVVLALLAAPTAAAAAPVLSAEVPAGGGRTAALADAAHPKEVDGRIGDWRGTRPGFGGAVLLSAGELLYEDHLFDAWGPDDGRDAERLAIQDPLMEAVPETYRIDPALQANLPGEFGLPAPEQLEYSTNYGDLEHADQADLAELRLAASRRDLFVLARTTTMLEGPAREGEQPVRTGLLLLFDTGGPETEPLPVPFGAGITSERADTAVLFVEDRGWVADLRSGAVVSLPADSVVTQPRGYRNAIEARVPRAMLGSVEAVAAATGLAEPGGDRLKALGLGANLANVAFRTGEPVRDWWDKRQALALHAGTIDPFFQDVDLARLTSGANESWTPTAGYHERIFASKHKISEEKGREGIRQHYGVYLPSEYHAGKASPLQFWMHWRGGSANAGAALAPKIFHELGEGVDTVVVSPRGRGTSRWYVGKGHVDFREVWRDVHRTFSVDRSRTYVAGHSMGGWASFLLTILYPDRFAAALPASPPVTQGMWTGLDFAGCDEYEAGGYTPCYGGANDGDARVQHTRRLLENVRYVPWAIFHGAADELVPVSGVTRQVERLVELGYRHRYYLFPHQEHYGPPVTDEWAEGARYMHTFARPRNPARVTYIRDMPFERATETIQSDKVPLDFSFDRAYWMSRLEPADPEQGVASFDGTSAALAAQPHLAVPEAGGPAAVGQTGPFVMTGLRWDTTLGGEPPAKENSFSATLKGARQVRLDMKRMAIDLASPVSARIDSDTPLTLELSGDWGKRAPVALAGGERIAAALRRGVLTLNLPAGVSELRLEPAANG